MRMEGYSFDEIAEKINMNTNSARCPISSDTTKNNPKVKKGVKIMNDECEIIQDLIPLVNDGVASNSSKELVLKHCKHCTICESMLNKELPIYQEEKLREKWKNSIQKSMLGILLTLYCFHVVLQKHLTNLIILSCCLWWVF